MAGVILGGIALFLRTETGNRIRQRAGSLAGYLPRELRQVVADVDADEVIGILAERAVAELRPAIAELFGQKR